MIQPLNAQKLKAHGQNLAVPAYDRSQIRPGVVHLGVGGFHRAHQAMYLDALMNAGQAFDWGICGVGVMAADRRMQQVMAAQHGLYTLVVKHADGRYQARVIGSIIDYLFAPDDPEAVIEQMASPSTRIVSLTVTEGGYNVDHVTGEFNFDRPDVARDLGHGAPPSTIFGLVTEALRRRRERALGAFTLMSCDNIPGNGDVARRAFAAFAVGKDAALGRWLEREVCFPNSMVDRITPATTERDIDQVRQRFGLDDAWPVVCEPFAQWLLEDRFSQGRPRYEDVGVQLVDDVEPYELMKLRLLNASHQALAYFGSLAGYRYAHDACQDPLFAAFLRAYMDEEATPTLAPVPSVDLTDYKRTLIARFCNPEIRDTLARLCAETSDRIPKFLLPVIREQLVRGGEIKCSAAVIASWARYAEGIDEAGRPIEIVDRLADELKPIAARNRDNRLAFVENRALFGDLVDDERFVTAYTDALERLYQDGVRATLEALCN